MKRTCRSCGSQGLELVLAMGDMPLANGLLTREQLADPEPRYPLDVAFCPHCTLLQITETVPPGLLFSDYPYLSSFSELENARDCVASALARCDLGPASLVIEVGSNDGYLLQFYAERGIPVLGIDPAENMVEPARERGVKTVCAYFGEALAWTLRAEHGQADVIHANNVFAHIDDLRGAVAGLGALLRGGGTIIIQVPYARDMIEHVEFDTIYHEHLCYFSITALYGLFMRHGLELFDVQFLPIHGGTARLFVRHAADTTALHPTDTILALLRAELGAGMCHLGFYKDFGAKVARLRDGLVARLDGFKRGGARIIGYAASAKGTTLLNYCGIGAETLDYVVDRSTVKQGRYTPGTHLRIEPPEKLLADMPDYALLLAWNHADKILAAEAEYRRRGGHFIVPVPTPTVI